ncbi:MAG: prohead protease [Desulfobacterales bacterium CG2_30_60_27]|nr:MAG: prohead protease [Desulfobacterales bacterium CG2_30_60_27]
MEVITSHLNADFDSLAAMVAARKLYPDAVLAFPGSQEKNVRTFLEQSESAFAFQRLKNITLEQVTRLIVVDTRQPGRIGSLAQCLKNPGIEVHLYDHHPDAVGDMKGDLEIVEPVGSTTTILARLFQEKNISPSRQEATLMAIAIQEDTGFFTFDTTTPADLLAMAWLLRQGANLQMAGQFLSQELTTHDVTLLHELIKSATTYTIHGKAIVVAKITLPAYVDEFALVVRRFMDMENLNTLFALASMAGRLYLIARSRVPEINVGKIAAEFGGGGHASAASATVRDLSLIEAEEKLIALLHRHVRPESLAGELMSAPVIAVAPDMVIQDANQMLTRYNITVLPVLNEKKEILGLISRRVMEKAIFHGLGQQAVSEYMTTDFATLPPTATLAEIQQIIIENRQRFIPVVEQGEVKGVITRTDLLNLLVTNPANLPKNLLDAQEQPSIARQRNLNQLMVETLGKKTIVLLRTIGETAQNLGYTAYAVGGFVRDLLRRVKNLDIDIVIEGDGIDFAKKLAAALKGTVRTHQKFRTALVTLPDGQKIDVATARLEFYEYPAALPTVELSSIKLDLYRRDFTINAMAVHLNPERFGALVDFFNCQNDIKDRQLRILHNLSFVEDPTRIFRAIRFEQRMGFTIGRHTEKLIRSAVAMNLFGRFAGHRFLAELRLLLAAENPLPALRRMAQFGLLAFLHPRIKLEGRLEEILEETQRALAWHKLLYLDEPCEPWLVYLLALMSRISGKDFEAFCDLVEMPPRQKQFMVQEKLQVFRIHRLLQSQPHPRPSAIYWLMQGLSAEGILFLMGVTRNKASKRSISLFVTHLRHVKPELTGDDLKKMGYPAGPVFQTILTGLLKAKLDGLAPDRAAEAALVRRQYPLADIQPRG